MRGHLPRKADISGLDDLRRKSHWQPYRFRTAEKILAVYSKKETWEEMLKDVEGDPEWHAFFKERIDKTFAGPNPLTEADTPDAIRSILRMEKPLPSADTQCGET